MGSTVNCTQVITDILTRFEEKRNSQYIQASKEVFDALNQIAPACLETLILYTRHIVHEIGRNHSEYEGVLPLFLRVLLRYDKIATIASVAEILETPFRYSKEEYVEILSDLQDKQVIPLLVTVLENTVPTSDFDAGVRAKAIRSLNLLDAHEVRAIVQRYICDPDYRVRAAAIRFCLDLNLQEATERFVSQLTVEQEDDADNLELLIRGVVQWQARQSLPALYALLEHEWVQSEDDLSSAIRRGIRALEAET